MKNEEYYRKKGIRPEEVSTIFIKAFSYTLWAIVLWFIFRDVIDAPTWGAWAVSVLYWYIAANGEWGRLLAERSV